MRCLMMAECICRALKHKNMLYNLVVPERLHIQSTNMLFVCVTKVLSNGLLPLVQENAEA